MQARYTIKTGCANFLDAAAHTMLGCTIGVKAGASQGSQMMKMTGNVEDRYITFCSRLTYRNIIITIALGLTSGRWTNNLYAVEPTLVLTYYDAHTSGLCQPL